MQHDGRGGQSSDLLHPQLPGEVDRGLCYILSGTRELFSVHPASGCELLGERTRAEKPPVPWELTQLACHVPTVLGGPEGPEEVWGQILGTRGERVLHLGLQTENLLLPDTYCGLQRLSGWWVERVQLVKRTQPTNLGDVSSRILHAFSRGHRTSTQSGVAEGASARDASQPFCAPFQQPLQETRPPGLFSLSGRPLAWGHVFREGWI